MKSTIRVNGIKFYYYYDDNDDDGVYELEKAEKRANERSSNETKKMLQRKRSSEHRS